jgi:hypothetical protein
MRARALLGVVAGALGALALGGALASGAAGCDGQTSHVAYGEPFRVRGAQFIEGLLPGTLPAEGATGGSATALAVTAIATLNPVVSPGEASKSLSGRSTGDASAIALRIGDLGSGYWVVPVGGPDPQYPGELTWSVAADFDADARPGLHPLRVVAIDARGNAGVQSELSLCLASRIPDNLNACEPTLAPPEAVLTLSWDADVDLDLHVLDPDGRDINPKQPLVVPVDAGSRPSPAAASFDRDSLAACTPDGRRQEDLVFPARPHGTWSVYANLFDACGKGGARFTFSVHEAEGGAADGTPRHLVETFTRSGRVIDLDANGDARPGLFVVQYPFD